LRVTIDYGIRGRLIFQAASLVVFLAGEFLKWQNPALAAGEKLGTVVQALRPVAMQNPAQSAN